MRVNSLSIKNFRCFNELSLTFSNRVMITGKNGSGKSSVLESLYFIMNGKSFRTTDLNDMIKDDEDYLFVESNYKDDFDWEHNSSFGFDRDGRKKILQNGEAAHRKDIMKAASVVVHSPEDIKIVDGPPSKKRDFLDRAIFLTEKKFYSTVVNYKSYLKQKKILLRNGNKNGLLYLNRAVIPYIEEIVKKRQIIAQNIEKITKKIFEEMSLPLSLKIILPDQDENIEEKLNSKIDKELLKGYSLYGPHLDIIKIIVLNRRGKSISMGEKSLISLILKFAEVQLLNDLGIESLFIGDDIIGFIDATRSDMIFSYCTTMENQFIVSHIDSENKKSNWEYITL
ncbi:DNA replication and repair protein RecF [bacterium]|nr:DNA replication and repair protein RecF [bacterium]